VSFRVRLTLFFVLIVALPMVALAVLVSQIAADSESGKVDARLSAGLRTATNVYEQAQRDSARAAHRLARQVAADSRSADLLRSGDLRPVATQLDGEAGVAVVRISTSSGHQVTVGPGTPVASASVELTDGGGSLATLTVSSVTSSELLGRIEQATGEDAALIGPDGPLTGTVPIETQALPDSGDAATVASDGGDVRVAATEPIGDEQARVALFASPGSEGFLSSRPKVAIALAAFLLIAIIAVALLLRVLQSQIKQMLTAARRIGDGDFTGQVPVSGNDEMARLASEFNKMSGRLSDQMDQLRRQRLEIEKSVRRVGEAFASGLDRQALLAILIETAVGTCGRLRPGRAQRPRRCGG
jgi:HAMP domain-containing protein